MGVKPSVLSQVQLRKLAAVLFSIFLCLHSYTTTALLFGKSTALLQQKTVCFSD